MPKPTVDDFRGLLDAAGDIVRGFSAVAECHRRGEMSPLGKYVQRKEIILRPGSPAEYDLVGITIPVSLADKLGRALAPFVVEKAKEAGN